MSIFRRNYGRLISLLFGFLFAAAGVEFVCRTVAPEWSDPWKLWRANPDYILELRPNLTDLKIHGTSREFSFLVTTNNEGFRASVDIPEEPASDSRRIMVIGDSFTFGYGVEQGETFPDLLPKFSPANSKPISTINAGLAGGMTTDTEYLFMKSRGVYWKPDTVVLAVSLSNDLADMEKTHWIFTQDDLTRVTEPLSSLPIWLRGSGLFNLFMKGILPRIHLAQQERNNRSLASGEMSVQDKLSWLLNAWAQHAADNHYRLFLVLIPERSEVEQPRNEDPNMPWAKARELYRQVAASAKVEAYDPLRALRLYSVQRHRPMYFSIDGHLTRHGHEFFAEWITPRLVVPDGAHLAINPN